MYKNSLLSNPGLITNPFVTKYNNKLVFQGTYVGRTSVNNSTKNNDNENSLRRFDNLKTKTEHYTLIHNTH